MLASPPTMPDESPAAPPTLSDRVAAAMPGWLLTICGLVIVGSAVLIPPWLEVRQLAWQKDVMTLQAQQLAAQSENYQRFREAIASDDPVLLERLAYVHLRVKPAGVSPLVTASERHGDVSILDPSASIDAWLHTPLPQEGVDYRPYQPIQSRLVRLTTGLSRIVLLGAGLCFMAAGIAATPWPDDRHLRPELRRSRFKGMWQRLRRRA
jgi:hypothetical protein